MKKSFSSLLLFGFVAASFAAPRTLPPVEAPKGNPPPAVQIRLPEASAS